MDNKNDGPDGNTEAGFRALLEYSDETLNKLEDAYFEEIHRLLRDFLAIRRAKVVREQCFECSKACPDEWWHLGKMGNADVCAFSRTVANTLKVIIHSLIENIKDSDPPPAYPDLISILQRIRDELDAYTVRIHRS